MRQKSFCPLSFVHFKSTFNNITFRWRCDNLFSFLGQELWQYQPPEVLPDLFDFGTLTASEMNHEEEEDDDLPIFFNNEKRQEEGMPNFFDNKETTLNTPKPSSNVGFHLGENGDIDISVEDLDWRTERADRIIGSAFIKKTNLWKECFLWWVLHGRCIPLKLHLVSDTWSL